MKKPLPELFTKSFSLAVMVLNEIAHGGNVFRGNGLRLADIPRHIVDIRHHFEYLAGFERSFIAEMKKLCGLIKDHWNEILNYFDYKFTNAILEGMNSIIQNVKRRARGFRNTEYFKTMIYLNCSDLDIEAVITMA